MEPHLYSLAGQFVYYFGEVMVMASSVQPHLPRRRSGHTTAVTIGAERLYLTANQRDDGSLGEIFIQWGKHGTSTAGLVSIYAIALSTGLAHRVPLAELIRPGLGQYFTPNGRTDDPEIPRVCSAVDYIARRLAVDWLPYSERAALGVFTLTERVRRWDQRAGQAAARALPAPGQQPGAHHLDHLAHRGGEV
jgi:ribonucleoside-diphosphate reductase alpha chain